MYGRIRKPDERYDESEGKGGTKGCYVTSSTEVSKILKIV